MEDMQLLTRSRQEVASETSEAVISGPILLIILFKEASCVDRH